MQEYLCTLFWSNLTTFSSRCYQYQGPEAQYIVYGWSIFDHLVTSFPSNEIKDLTGGARQALIEYTSFHMLIILRQILKDSSHLNSKINTRLTVSLEVSSHFLEENDY